MTRLLLSLATAALLFGAGTARAEMLTYGTYLSATHNINKEAVAPYFKAVKKATDGSLTFHLFSDGTVVGGSNATKGVRDGIVDMALIIPAYSPELLPVTATFAQLGLFTTTSLAGTASSTEMIMLHCDQCMAEWKNLGIKPLSFYSTAPYYLMCTDKVNDLASMEGKRIRGTGPWPEWIAAMGAIPVSLAGGETYSALNRGTIDCTVGPRGWLQTYGLKDIVKYVMDMPVGAYRPLAFMDISTEKWNSLGADQQAALVGHLDELTANAAWSYRTITDEAIAAAKKEGVQFVPPGEKMKPRYQEFLKTERERFLKIATERGVKNPEALLERYLKIIDKWNGIVAGIETKKEYRQALQKHIFSKIEY